MTAIISVSDARANLPGLVDRVQAGEEVTLTRHGVPVAVLVHPAALATRRAAGTFEMAARLGRLLDDARDRPLVAATSVDTETAERWVAELRRDRRAR
jgi:prevent-host-death family protein